MKLRSLITSGLVVAAIAVPAAAAGSDDSYIGHPGGPGGAGPVLVQQDPSDSYIGHPGGPGAAGPVLVQQDASGSYIGHPGGPGAAGPLVPVGAAPTAGGFDWADGAVGAGFMAGIGLLAAGAALMLRRRGMLAHLRS